MVSLFAAACTTGQETGPLTVYSGRGEELVGPLLERFQDESGVEVEIRYAGSPELAATLLEEGTNTPADVFYAQDPASLGAVAKAGMLETLPDSILDRVPADFRDAEGQWVGTSGRARVVVYNTENVSEDELPSDIWDLTDSKWRGRIGVAPTNGSFLTFVAAMILTEGEDRTREWLEGIAANQPVTFDGNSPIVAATDAGDVDLGLVNHYYLYRLEAEQGEVTAANHFLTAGDPGSLIMTAGAGVLATADQPEEAQRLVEFLLSQEAQTYFRDETFEYPLIEGVDPAPRLPALVQIQTPDLDLSDLADTIDQATDLVADAGLI